jgi:hypothetical protein
MSHNLKHFELFLVLKLRISKYCLNNVLLVTINRAKESIYCEAKDGIFKVLKNVLQESLALVSISILTFRFLKFENVQTVGRSSPEYIFFF